MFHHPAPPRTRPHRTDDDWFHGSLPADEAIGQAGSFTRTGDRDHFPAGSRAAAVETTARGAGQLVWGVSP